MFIFFHNLPIFVVRQNGFKSISCITWPFPPCCKKLQVSVLQVTFLYTPALGWLQGWAALGLTSSSLVWIQLPSFRLSFILIILSILLCWGNEVFEMNIVRDVMKSFLQIKSIQAVNLLSSRGTKIVNSTLPRIFPPSPPCLRHLLFEMCGLIPWPLLIPPGKHGGEHLILYHSTMSVFSRIT